MWDIYVRRAFLRTAFVFAPAVIVTGAILDNAREAFTRSMSISPKSYTTLCCIIIWAVTWVTTRGVYDDLRKHKAIVDARKEK
jgi:hypothetical protein